MIADGRCHRLARLAISVLWLTPLPVLAWNAAGHRLVACIAWESLAPAERLTVSDALRAHPDHARWLQRAKGDDADRGAFIEASTWADEIRYDPRFFDANRDEATALLPGFPDMERHRNWHYMNRSIAGKSEAPPTSGQIEERLVALTKTIAAPASRRRDLAYSLPWLIHLVADAHQPLHVGVRLDQKGKHDPEMNGERVINPNASQPRKRNSTLHAYWDDLPGPSWLRGEKFELACRALRTRYTPPAPSFPSQWIDESWRLARQYGYPPGAEKTPVISIEFAQTSQGIADRRIAEAGYRLAEQLHAALTVRRAKSVRQLSD